MKIGQLIKINSKKLILIKEDENTYTFINTYNGDQDSILKSIYDTLTNKEETTKTYKDLHISKWILAKIYSSLDLKYSLELKKDK